MKRHYRTHCFKTFGGEDWMKILLAIGHCRENVIDIANVVIRQKIEVKAERVAATHTTGLDARLSKRTRAAVEGRPLPPVQPPSRGVSENETKSLREKAKAVGRKIKYHDGITRRAVAREIVYKARALAATQSSIWELSCLDSLLYTQLASELTSWRARQTNGQPANQQNSQVGR
jgi:hypothetical protein